MEPLDLTLRPPRPSRATLLGYFFLPRTIDKLRAQLPGGKIGPYLNHDTGLSAYVVRKLGLDMDEFRAVIARAKDEDDVVDWLSDRIDPAGADALNAKLATFVVSRMPPARSGLGSRATSRDGGAPRPRRGARYSRCRRPARVRDLLAAMESRPDTATHLVDGAENARARTSTSERLLDTAAKLFWTNGYASTTTREIAELLGVRKASLYHHISSKEDLLFQISVNSLEHITRAVTVAVEASDDPVERVRTLIGAHVASMIADQDKHSVMLTELRALSPGRRAQIVAMRDEYEHLVAGVLGRARSAGALRGDVPVKYLALSLLNLLNWSIFWFQREGDLSPGRLAEYLTTLYLSGACKAAEGGHRETEPAARSGRSTR